MNPTRIMLSAVMYLVLSALLFAQNSGMKPLPFEDLSAFQSQSGNWQIVGDVMMDPTVDIHAQPPLDKKKKKKKKSEAPPRPITSVSGTGVLLNMPDDDKKSHLVTNWEHGDIALEVEVMIPKGSNSGLYLQGRYEIQLCDSWGVKTARFSDIGGIYRNWEQNPETSYMGKAPLVNAAKAPGLWQKLEVVFKAPRFDASGNKIANARVISTTLNGVKIHDNVEIPRPTGGPLVNDEVALGPIMIQGDHGPVAFRNFQYKLIGDLDIRMEDLNYEVHHGPFETESEVKESAVVKSGSISALTYEVAGKENEYGIVFTGELTVPETTDYFFDMVYGGIGNLKIDGASIGDGWGGLSASTSLQAGLHSIEVVLFKAQSWVRSSLSLMVSTTNSYPVALHTFSSSPPGSNLVPPILIEPKSEVKLLRAFLDFKGDRSQRLTHTIGVGEPDRIHYIYDLNAGNLVCVWKGDFVDATPMWHDRGDGSFRPIGMLQYLFSGPSLAVLDAPGQGFPSSSTDFISKGYKLDYASRRPTFLYEYKGAEVSDQIVPDEEAKYFIRKVIVSNPRPNTYLKVAEGRKIELLPNGWYAVDDKQYYINIQSGQVPSVRSIGDVKELILPVDTTPIQYSLTW